MKLQEIEVPRFNESPMNRAIFFDFYSSTVHKKKSILVSDDYSMLVSLLQSRAKLAIKYLTRMENVYQKVIGILIERFEKVQLRQ